MSARASVGRFAASRTQATGSYNRQESDGVYRYEYDAEGNRTRRYVDNGDGQYGVGDTSITEYGWDHRNRLTSVVDRASHGGSETQRVEHAYDGLNQWIGRDVTAGGVTERTVFVHEGGQTVLRLDKTGTGDATASDLSHRYLWGDAVDQLLADEAIDWSDGQADGDTRWALADHLGTARDLVDDAGATLNHKAYNAFGEVVSETDPAVDTLFGYTGRAMDDATGLQNNLNRWYDASVGAWVSEDPIGFAAGDANLQRYVGNATTRYIDPTGLDVYLIDSGASNWGHQGIQLPITDPTDGGRKTLHCDFGPASDNYFGGPGQLILSITDGPPAGFNEQRPGGPAEEAAALQAIAAAVGMTPPQMINNINGETPCSLVPALGQITIYSQARTVVASQTR